HNLQTLASGNRGVVAALELLQHHATEFGHKDLLMTSRYSSLQGRFQNLAHATIVPPRQRVRSRPAKSTKPP
ncbi:MAG: hypothetical protein WB384_24395, partial [Candidatus Sulfotelmatobacter sp.]